MKYISAQWHAWHEPHCVSNHRQLVFLFNSLLRLTSKNTSKLCISYWPFVNPPPPPPHTHTHTHTHPPPTPTHPHKGPVYRRVFACHQYLCLPGIEWVDFTSVFRWYCIVKRPVVIDAEGKLQLRVKTLIGHVTLGLALLTLSWDKNWDSHSPIFIPG